MKNSIYLLIVLIAASMLASAQYIRIERTDVDSSRSTFITASYKFGMDIYAEDVANCNGVAFEMRYNKKDYIKYSGYDRGDFPNVNITVLNDVDYVRVIVNAGSGLQADDDGIDNPKIIHLEFVVLQSAPDFELEQYDTEFSFLAPVATYFSDNGIQSVFLEANPIYYKIHGFINVWPGDTDNNGIVDYLDYEPVNRFMSLGSKSKNMRSFKRINSSSIWVPQRVLKWDSAMVTYADCDGNADITMQDALIVTYNLNKTHDIVAGGIKNQAYDAILSNITPKIYSNFDTKSENFHVDMPYNILAVAGSISIDNAEYFDIIGIENGDIFTSKPYILERNNSEAIEFAIGSNDFNSKQKVDNLLLKLIYRPIDDINEEPIFNLNDLVGITDNGSIIPLNRISSVKESLNSNFFNKEGDLLIYINQFESESILIYDYLGNLIFSDQNISQFQTIDITNYSTGIYFVLISSGNQIYQEKFSILR